MSEETITVKVFAGAKKEKFDLPNVYVREPAQKNLANHRVRELLATHFGVALGNVQILTGHHSPKKRIVVKM